MALIKRKVSFIIPVYNGYDVTRALIASLERIYPTSQENIQFIVLNDSSTDTRVPQYLANHLFFQRSDVLAVHNPSNLGFIQTVNKGILLADSESDILLLNSDTEIFSDIAADLQSIAYRFSDVGTVTPLTNSGTIASLFHYPDGGAIPTIFTKHDIAKAITELNINTPDISAPTGVGFAMYITRTLLNSVGLLDPAYGKGYGEECDLCQRAIKKGFKNLIATNTFVYHKGSESFGASHRTSLVLANSAILNGKFPNYENDVTQYIERNPLGLARLTIVYQLLTEIQSSPKTKTMHILHSNLDHPNAGGTERHVDWLTNSLPTHLSMIVSPTQGSHKYTVTLKYEDFAFKELVTTTEIMWLVNYSLQHFDTVHVHHTLNVKHELIDLIVQKAQNIVVSAHDYYFICPTINLLTTKDKDIFCNAETDEHKCNRCLETFHYITKPIGLYRNNSRILLEAASKILCPSESAKRYMDKVFPDLSEKIVVLGHDLTHYRDLIPHKNELHRPLADKPTIVFLGAIGHHKGANLAITAANILKKKFHLKIIGSIDQSLKSLSREIPIEPYGSPQELSNIFSKAPPDVIVIPSVWAETFCYTFYEAILLSEAVPVVSKYGNPADMVTKYGCGVVYDSDTVNALEKALEKALDQKDLIKENIERFRTILLQETAYEIQYLEAITNIKKKSLYQKPRLTLPQTYEVIHIKEPSIKEVTKLALRHSPFFYRTARLLYSKTKYFLTRKSLS